jgi:hypothetical protein
VGVAAPGEVAQYLGGGELVARAGPHLAEDDDWIRLSVTDDGCGGAAPSHTGSGLAACPAEPERSTAGSTSSAPPACRATLASSSSAVTAGRSAASAVSWATLCSIRDSVMPSDTVLAVWAASSARWDSSMAS